MTPVAHSTQPRSESLGGEPNSPKAADINYSHRKLVPNELIAVSPGTYVLQVWKNDRGDARTPICLSQKLQIF